MGDGERVVTIEDAAELRLRQPHVVRLEARPPNLEGRGEVTIRRLVRNALRMRPDRIIVGEVRGAEALDMLTALSTGHDGSLCTVHAGSPTEALRRIEVLALMSDVGLPHAAIREQVADAFDLVVCQARCSDGDRRVVAVAEVIRVAGGPAARELYTWRDGSRTGSPRSARAWRRGSRRRRAGGWRGDGARCGRRRPARSGGVGGLGSGRARRAERWGQKRTVDRPRRAGRSRGVGDCAVGEPQIGRAGWRGRGGRAARDRPSWSPTARVSRGSWRGARDAEW